MFAVEVPNAVGIWVEVESAHNVQTARSIAQRLADSAGAAARYRDRGTGRTFAVEPR